MRQVALSPAPETIQSASEKYAVLLDTDIGDDIDDALALALILRSPEIALKGVTTVFGDTKLRACLATYLLHIYGRDDVPVVFATGNKAHPHVWGTAPAYCLG